ncbi:MAG: HD domain-containing protein, partial [Sphingobacteriales bacterium]
MNDSIYKKVSQYVTGLFEEYPHPNLTYHDLGHTKTVVARAQEIAAHYQLNENDMLAVYSAAWFHDTGHLFAEISGHEDKSVEIMKEFMLQHGYGTDVIQLIEGCIRATRIPHEPKGLLQEILCDADTYHFGTKEFKKTNKLIHKEYELRGYTTFTIDWEKNTLELLEQHQFFTSYCQVLLNEGKQKNIERARKRFLGVNNLSSNTPVAPEEKDPASEKQKMSIMARGLQT